MHIDYLSSIKKNNMGLAGMCLLGMMCMVAVVAPLLTVHSPVAPSTNTLATPSPEHLLGTNDIGQDILSRVIYGTRTSLTVAFLAGLLTTILSTFLGGTAALIGGAYERFIMRMADVFLTLPNIMVIILIAAYVRPSIGILVIVLSAFSWQGSARVIRSQVLSLKQRPHIWAARTFGAGKFYLLAKHIIPDLVPMMIAVFVQHARRAVFMEAGLAFLGITDPTMVSWGTMLKKALEFSYLGVWHWLLPPGIALSLTVISFAFVGYALEQALNPRLG
ncbi:ABC transporter permease [Calderihabitans maritimus]|uniref:Binding-protein-dependent transport system inner membrane protein n=1 Tax=Calderihabitans maritimus TaxID=1246530 RepID=A0A1Z5HSK6_9FIRM|nr:ABC transporter permease [Calderihabitans maritimus]GAW92504.1 binding-protein-dependent transport system inner membrane protein [Calderihabitans maritimus]